jgi:hypothetical protein
MAKLSYLQLVNRVLKRITQSELSSGVSTSTGQAKIISELINEAQNELWTETSNWYSLFKMRTFSLVPYTASTIAFVEGGASADTITDTANGFGNFQPGQTIYVSGSTSNDGIYVIGTAVAGTITLQTSDDLTAEVLGDSVTIYPITYPVASDWGRTHHLVDITNNRVLTEEYTRSFDEANPAMDSYSNPSHFSMQGDFYRFYYPASSTVKIIDRYWAIPDALSGDSDTSDLPIFCENFIIHWAWMSILDYLNKFEQADRIRVKIYGSPTMKDDAILQKIKAANKKMLDIYLRFEPQETRAGLQPPKFPAHY